MAGDEIAITLTRDEALVLFELSARYVEKESLTIEHPGEEAALWRLNGAFEKALTEPLLPDYLDRLAAARVRLAEQAGTG